MKRKYSLYVHASATKPSQDIGVAEITVMHKKKRWRTIGYNYVIRRDGTLEIGRKIGSAAHAKGYNNRVITICMVGGVDSKKRPECNYTKKQWKTLAALHSTLRDKFDVVGTFGHRDLPNVAKECPCFDVSVWAYHLGNGKSAVEAGRQAAIAEDGRHAWTTGGGI